MKESIEIRGMLFENMNVTLACEYFEKQGIDVENHENVFGLGYDDIQEILCMEVAYYLTRRVSGSDQYISDTIWALRRKLINAYEIRFDVEYIEYNQDIDF